MVLGLFNQFRKCSCKSIQQFLKKIGPSAPGKLGVIAPINYTIAPVNNESAPVVRGMCPGKLKVTTEQNGISDGDHSRFA